MARFRYRVLPGGRRQLDRGTTVPEGTVDEILEAVGTDADLARAALTREVKSDTPRVSLIRKLEALADG